VQHTTKHRPPRTAHHERRSARSQRRTVQQLHRKRHARLAEVGDQRVALEPARGRIPERTVDWRRAMPGWLAGWLVGGLKSGRDGLLGGWLWGAPVRVNVHLGLRWGGRLHMRVIADLQPLETAAAENGDVALPCAATVVVCSSGRWKGASFPLPQIQMSFGMLKQSKL
jgi:hypothetical protein